MNIKNQKKHIKQRINNSQLPCISHNQSRISKFACTGRLNPSIMSPLCQFDMTYNNFTNRIIHKIPEIGKKEYKYLTVNEINQEFVNLKTQLKLLSQNLNRRISTKSPKNINNKQNHTFHKKIVSLTSNADQINIIKYQNQRFYQQLQINNSVIKNNHNIELKKLLDRSHQIDNPAIKKMQLTKQIQQLTLAIKQSKTNCKKSLLESQKIGNQLLNVDKCMQQIYSYQKQLSLLLVRKSRLTFQSSLAESNLQKLKCCQYQLLQKQYQLQVTPSTQKQQKLIQTYEKKQKIIQTLKKSIESKDKVKQRQYYQLLMQMEQKMDSVKTTQDKCRLLDEHLQNNKQIYSQVKDIQAKKAERHSWVIQPNQQYITKEFAPKYSLQSIEIKGLNQRVDTQSSIYQIKQQDDFTENASTLRINTQQKKQQAQEVQVQAKIQDEIVACNQSENDVMEEVHKNIKKTVKNIEEIQRKKQIQNKLVKKKVQNRPSFFDKQSLGSAHHTKPQNKTIHQQKNKFDVNQIKQEDNQNLIQTLNQIQHHNYQSKQTKKQISQQVIQQLQELLQANQFNSH